MTEKVFSLPILRHPDGQASLSIFAWLLLSILFLPLFANASAEKCQLAQQVRPEWQRLACRLAADGISPDTIRQIFSRPEMTFDARVMPRKLTHNEYGLYYDRFLKEERIARAKLFLDRNRGLLERVEKRFGVPKEIMVAILLVETDLGRYLGAGPAVRILASMAAADSVEIIDKWLPESMKASSKVQKKMKKKAAWAYNELKELIFYCQRNRLDIMKLKGSIFGAIGICQFMPSNANTLGVDFDGDGRVDLFSLPDALASMANYLKHHGWRPGLDKQGRHEVILAYNHSRPYADTILKVAEQLAGQSG